MSWQSIDGLFGAEERRRELAEDRVQRERLAGIRREVERTRPPHFVDVYRDRQRRRRPWRVECCCGWRASFLTEAEAREEAEWHR